MDDPETILAAEHKDSGSIILLIDPEDKEFFSSRSDYTLRIATPSDLKDTANSVRY